jgi:DNA repair exonuclease SbcCD ATPase subunit
LEHLTLFEDKIPYTVKKLIAVNSISYCYIELDIDRHCALFGRNNVGKTSLLNALKLHFFPEISFNDCKNKFAFKSSKGELYSSADSYSYYFPSDSSFLILEAENIHGCFSIILFKSNNSFGYQRLALPCEYAEIRKNFWDIDKTEVNSGLGSPVFDLGIAKIQTLFQLYQKQGAVFLKTTKDIKERLFNHSPMNRDKGRYCLVPLKDGGKERELSAFRQLMNFTFEIAKTETKGLTETFATIIESGKINVRDELHQDLQAILDEYEELRSTQDKLKAIANYSDSYKGLTEMQQNFVQQQNGFANRFSAYSLYLGEQNKNLKQQTGPVEKEVIRLTNEKSEFFKLAGDKEIGSTRFEGQLKELNNSLNQLNEKASQFKTIRKEYSSLSIDEIEAALKKNKQELQDEINQSGDQQLAIEALSNNIALQKTKYKAIKEKRQAVEQQEKLLISQLDEHSAKVLSHINPRFSEISLNLETAPQEIIEGFGALFTTQNNQLDFLGEVFSPEKLKSPQEIQAQLKKEIDDLNIEIKALDKKIKTSNELSKLSISDQQLKSQEASKKLAVVKKELVIVHSIEEIQSQWQVKIDEIEEIGNQQRRLKKEKEDIEILLAQSKNAYILAKEQADSLSNQVQEVQGLLQSLDALKADNLKATENLVPESVTVSDLANLAGDQKKLASIRQALDNKINEFIQCGHFQLPIELAYNSYSHQQQEEILMALKNTFAALPEQQDTLDSRIIGHNKTTGTKISELTGNRTHIRNFINKINAQFSGYSISNLQDIQVEVELDHRFEALIKELDQTNLNNKDIHDDALYQRLNEFCNDFFTAQGSRVLEISKIIKNVKYSYKKAHQDKREDKDQSTGTNALINCTLLTILLSDLLAQESNLKIPVIFDEFSSLDEFNQRTAIDVADEQGFSLFCAAPTDTAEVVALVNYYICLDDFHVNKTYDSSGERDVVFHHFQERLYDALEQES